MLDNVDRADEFMDVWVPYVEMHGCSPKVYHKFIVLLVESYEQVCDDKDPRYFLTRANRVWDDDDWDMCNIEELRDLIAIDLDDMEQRGLSLSKDDSGEEGIG